MTTDIIGIVKFLNQGLSDGEKVSELRKKIDIPEKKLQRLLKDSGYKFNQKLKQYIKYDVEDKVNITADVTIQDECKSSTTDVVTQSNYNMVAEMPIEFFDAINRMNEMSSKFEQMYNWYEMQTKVIDVPDKPELKVIPNENVTVTRSMRLYLDTYERFTAFTKSNKDKRVQDILDAALREFLDKYEER
ncbi:DNA-binding protein [Paraclostridium sordellii]